MGKVRYSALWFIACGATIFFAWIYLLATDLILVPCKLDPRTDAWMMPFPIVQSDGTVQVIPTYSRWCNSLRAVVRDDGSVKIEGQKGTDEDYSGSVTVVLEPELATNFNKFSSITLTSHDFHSRDWRVQGNLRIYSTEGGKKNVELYLDSLSLIHKSFFGEYELVDNKLILSNWRCKRYLLYTSVALFSIALFSVFIGFALLVIDTILSLIKKKRGLAHDANAH